MCGIVGSVGLRDEEIGTTMVRRIAHRGPDDEGIWLSPPDHPPVMLGSRRLAILDLSPAGHMPMFSADGRFIIVYNGEVYNYKELRQELKDCGHRFQSSGDTEVILAAYEQWGLAALRRFNGMFAIAIWDRQRHRLFLARDRMGVKPLYYANVHGAFIFSSEIKSILVPGLHEAKVNKDALPAYLQYQYVPWPDTLFEGIKKLPPAHYAIHEHGTLTVSRYWNPPDQQGGPELDDDELRALLDDAVRLRLISDVPVGVFLSGGIDSSIVTAMASAHVSKLVSYTVRYDVGETRYDEGEAARGTAEHLKIENRQVVCSVSDAVKKIPTLVWYLDEPVADTLVYPFFALSQQARNTFTVALSGEGADELFFGYRYYTLERIRRWVSPWLPEMLRRLIHRRLWLRDLSTDLLRRAIASVIARTTEEAFEIWSRATFSTDEIAELLALPVSQTRTPTLTKGRLPNLPLRDSQAVAPFYDTHFRLVDFILTVRDKMSMAVGLEVRMPFLDFRIVEASFAIPVARKLIGRATKVIVHKIASSLLPRRVAIRRKVPFAAPVHFWLEPLSMLYLRNSELVRDNLLSPDGIARWNRFENGRCKYPYKLWSLVVLEIWYRVFITRSLAPQLVPLAAPAYLNSSGTSVKRREAIPS